MTKSVFGLDENIAAALSNATFGVFGLVAIVKERENKFVRFHGLQSVITFLGLAVVSGVLNLICGIFGKVPVVGWLVSTPFGIVNFAIGLVTTVAWAYLTYTAYKGRMVKVPLVGDAVMKQLEK